MKLKHTEKIYKNKHSTNTNKKRDSKRLKGNTVRATRTKTL